LTEDGKKIFRDKNQILSQKLVEMKKQLEDDRSIRKEIIEGTLHKYKEFTQKVNGLSLKHLNSEEPSASMAESQEMSRLLIDFKKLNQVVRLEKSNEYNGILVGSSSKSDSLSKLLKTPLIDNPSALNFRENVILLAE